MTPSLLDAYETLSVTATLADRLAAAVGKLGKTKGNADEKLWLAAAEARLAPLRGVHGELLRRAVRLPELEAVRGDFADGLQHHVIDLIEKLFAGITFHAGSRSPVLETLSAKLKLPQLRRVDAPQFDKFCIDFEKRLNGSYMKRQLSSDDFAFARPVLEQLKAAIADWRAAGAPPPFDDETQAAALAKELRAAAKAVELAMKQARLLAEAALAPLDGAFEELGLNVKPKKRAAVKKVETVAAAAAPLPVEEPAADAAAESPTVAEVDATEAAAAADALEPAAEKATPKAKKAQKAKNKKPKKADDEAAAIQP